MNDLNQNKSHDLSSSYKPKWHSFLKVFLAICLSIFIFAWAVFTIDPKLFILDVSVTQANYSHTTLIVMEGEAYVNGERVESSRILEVGDVVETATGAKALIDFFDNSVTRLREKTNLEITEMDVNPENQMETNILLKLNAGQVWNKVTKIVTQDSSFEVETYNTIAAVRGSAFDIKVDAETQATEVVVAQHAVDLTAVNEKSGEILGTTQVLEGYKTRIKKQLRSDRDHDGLFDDEEILFGTDPDNPDTDGDGFLDGYEVKNGFNPLGEGRLDEAMDWKIKNQGNEGAEQTEASERAWQTDVIFETRELLESEKTSEWMKDNALLDEQHVEQVIKEEEAYKQAVAGMLPDNPLYALKNIKDKVVLGVSGDQFRKFIAELEIASRKMIEANILFRQDKEDKEDKALELVQTFKNTVKSVGLQIDQHGLTNEEQVKIKNKIGEVLDFHKRLLGSILPDSEMYDLKELMYELEIESTLDYEEKKIKETEYKKRFATDILDLTKETDDKEVINQVLEDYQVRFDTGSDVEAEDKDANSKVSDALIASAEWLLVEKARLEAEAELSSSDKVQKAAAKALEELAEKKRLEEEQARKQAEIQRQREEELAKQQAEAEAARIRAEKIAAAEEAKRQVEEAKRLDAERKAAEAARIAAEEEAARLEAERISAEQEATDTEKEADQTVEETRVCTNSATDWEKKTWWICQVDGTQTRRIVKKSDCDDKAPGSYVPPTEQKCDPCDGINLASRCDGTTYKSRAKCKDGYVTYGREEKNSDKCGHVEEVRDCVESDWNTGNWSVCNDSWISTRTVTKKSNVTCNGNAAKPEDQYGCSSSETGTALNYDDIDCVDQGTRYQNSEGEWSDYYGEAYNTRSKSCSVDGVVGKRYCNNGDYGSCALGETCESGLHWNSAEKTCDPDQKTGTCEGKPVNSVWVSPSGVESENGKYEANWNGSAYVPSDSDCRWECESGYHEEGGACVANSREADCAWSVDPNGQKTSSDTFTQTWWGSSWSEVKSWKYSNTAGDCTYECKADVTELNGQCYKKCTGPDWSIVAHNSSKDYYSDSSVGYGESCDDVKQTRTCKNGSLSWSYVEPTCSIDSASSCNLPWGGVINHGESVTAYDDETVDCGENCDSIQRKCDNGNLEGDSSYDQETCEVEACPPTDAPNLTNVAWSGNQLSLDFNDVNGATEYQLCKNGSSVSNPSLSNKKFIPNTSATYSVAACKAGSCGSCGNKVFTVVANGNAWDIQVAVDEVHALVHKNGKQKYFKGDLSNVEPRPIFIARGQYSGNSYIDIPHYTHLIGDPENKPVIKTGIIIDGTPDNSFLGKDDYGNDITIENLRIENTRVSRSNEVWFSMDVNMGIFVKGNASGVIIKNNDFTVTGNCSRAIFNKGSDISKITDNTITWPSWMGIESIGHWSFARIWSIAWNSINVTGSCIDGAYNLNSWWIRNYAKSAGASMFLNEGNQINGFTGVENKAKNFNASIRESGNNNISSKIGF